MAAMQEVNAISVEAARDHITRVEWYLAVGERFYSNLRDAGAPEDLLRAVASFNHDQSRELSVLQRNLRRMEAGERAGVG